MEESAGLRMRIDALNAKINGQIKLLEMRGHIIKSLEAKAEAFEAVALKIMGLCINRCINHTTNNANKPEPAPGRTVEDVVRDLETKYSK